MFYYSLDLYTTFSLPGLQRCLYCLCFGVKWQWNYMYFDVRFFVSLVIIVSIKNILGFIIFNFVCSIRFKYKFGFYCYCMLSVIENEMVSRVNTLVSRFLNVLKWNDQSLEVSHQVSNVIPEELQRRSTFYLK